MAKEPQKHEPEDARDHTLADVRALARVLRQYELSELEVERGGTRIRLSRGGMSMAAAVAAPMAAPVAAPAAGAPVEEQQPDDGSVVITSPFVGTFYRAPSPESPPFVEAGQSVSKGTTLCIVEAMKLMNEIEAEVDCRIVEILVKNGEPVEFGQPLFKVLPA